MGKWGDVLWSFVNGFDQSPVSAPIDEQAIIKSIGISTTTSSDLVDNEDAKMTSCILVESVAARLREHASDDEAEGLKNILRMIAKIVC